MSEETLLLVLLATEVGPPKPGSDWLKELEHVYAVIQNRVNDSIYEFRLQNSIKSVILAPYQFSAVGGRQWCKALTGDRRYAILLDTIADELPNLLNREPAVPALFYYSPISMRPKNSKPSWNFNLLKENHVSGIDKNRFRFYSYKEIR